MAVEAARSPAKPAPRGGGGPGTLRHSAAPAWWFLGLEVGLLAAAVLAPLAARTALVSVAAGLGVAGLFAGIRWHRPSPVTGWWFLAGAAALCVVGFLVIVAGTGTGSLTAEVVDLTSDAPPLDPVAVILIIISYLLLAVALVLLGRHGNRADGIDLLDASLTTATVFPLLWYLIIAPILDATRLPTGAAVLVPVSMALVVALVVKLALAAGPRWSAGWLLLAVVMVLLTNTLALLPTVAEAGFSLELVPVMWAGYPAALGVAGLHPSMREIPARRAWPQPDLSVHRLLLLGSLALLVPTGLLVADLTGLGVLLGTRASVAVLVGSVIAVAMLLMVRLAVAARLAQHRAVQLAEQARQLDAAVHEQAVLSQQLTYRALHDPLTGLANRVVLRERLERVLARGTGTHALLLLDLDGFKDVNDTWGHQFGDDLLIAVAHRIVGSVPRHATLARLGGDELAVLLEGMARDRAVAWAEQTLSAIRRPFYLGGRALYQTVSMGMAMLESGTGGTTPSDALRDADLALYAAKDAGRDRMREFDPAMMEARSEHSRLTAGLRRALARGEFSVQYQPVVDLASDQVRVVEAVLRWCPPGAGPVPPEKFLPVAEETGLIAEIGRWLLRHACRRARRWWHTGRVALAVDISGRQLVEPDFPRVIADALHAADLPGEALILQLTESSVIATAAADQAARQLSSVRDQGVRVAIADFGTGYSSLSYLARLQVDILKIDNSLARGRAGPASGLAGSPFARAIMQLGEGLRLTTVAEGIDTPEQADAVRRLRCQLAQGRLFSGPVPPEEMDRLLAARAGGS